MGLFGKLGSKKGNDTSVVLSEDIAESLNEEKRDMIQGVVDLSETSVKEVMVPRIDVDFLSIDTGGTALLAKVAESGHSRFPVYGDSIDNVIGVLYVKDLIQLIARKEEINLEKIIRKPFFVPESKRIDALLREFKRRHVHIAIAIDEYGGVSGIVCMEDIIEEIVGDIQDEFDNEREDVLPIGDGVWLCDARASLDDLTDVFQEEMPVNEEFETLGGFVFDLLGKIPVKYEKVSWKNFDFIIQDMEGHRINTVKIVRKKKDKYAEKKCKRFLLFLYKFSCNGFC
ncbi:hemolysin family protein [Brucepastera parasyntrophica]|uniref:hemolysin family protein n=1 Tax=Brucepastera parasyntrophica TaxID=2880008 RepID=UPI00210C9AE4|nr:hemolysin family protein [Brucepastera parasyntrophica]ULQ59922.1 hemolysin family protein [Brucepastera parasyntrophica]